MNKQFQEWFYSISKYSDMIYSDGERGEYRTNIQYVWDSLPFSCQWGVYLEFFDSVGISISCEFKNEYIIRDDNKGQQWYGIDFESRQEAQQEAIKKAFERL